MAVKSDKKSDNGDKVEVTASQPLHESLVAQADRLRDDSSLKLCQANMLDFAKAVLDDGEDNPFADDDDGDVLPAGLPAGFLDEAPLASLDDAPEEEPATAATPDQSALDDIFGREQTAADEDLVNQDASASGEDDDYALDGMGDILDDAARESAAAHQAAKLAKAAKAAKASPSDLLPEESGDDTDPNAFDMSGLNEVEFEAGDRSDTPEQTPQPAVAVEGEDFGLDMGAGADNLSEFNKRTYGVDISEDNQSLALSSEDEDDVVQGDADPDPEADTSWDRNVEIDDAAPAAAITAVSLAEHSDLKDNAFIDDLINESDLPDEDVDIGVLDAPEVPVTSAEAAAPDGASDLDDIPFDDDVFPEHTAASDPEPEQVVDDTSFLDELNADPAPADEPAAPVYQYNDPEAPVSELTEDADLPAFHDWNDAETPNSSALETMDAGESTTPMTETTDMTQDAITPEVPARSGLFARFGRRKTVAPGPVPQDEAEVLVDEVVDRELGEDPDAPETEVVPLAVRDNGTLKVALLAGAAAIILAPASYLGANYLLNGANDAVFVEVPGPVTTAVVPADEVAAAPVAGNDPANVDVNITLNAQGDAGAPLDPSQPIDISVLNIEPSVAGAPAAPGIETIVPLTTNDDMPSIDLTTPAAPVTVVVADDAELDGPADLSGMFEADIITEDAAAVAIETTGFQDPGAGDLDDMFIADEDATVSVVTDGDSDVTIVTEASDEALAEKADASEVASLRDDIRLLSEQMQAVQEGFIERDDETILRDQRLAEAESAANDAKAMSMAQNELIVDFVRLKDNVGIAESLIVDLSERLAVMEVKDPADRLQTDRMMTDLTRKVDGLARDIGMIARLSINGGSKIDASADPRKSTKTPGPSDTNMVYQEGASNMTLPGTSPASIPADVKIGDNVQGYGEVLDIVAMENGSRLVVLESDSVIID